MTSASKSMSKNKRKRPANRTNRRENSHFVIRDLDFVIFSYPCHPLARHSFSEGGCNPWLMP